MALDNSRLTPSQHGPGADAVLKLAGQEDWPDVWYAFSVVKVSENHANGSPYKGQFATSLVVRCARDARQLG